ncbi:MAG: YihY/virulence factor BrkB family protein [Bacteroidetes bacterium]|nr:YihY/virulence factor BrkB family protein [Bacteroidota bacterium]
MNILRRIQYYSHILERWLQKKLSFIVLPGFDGMPLYDVMEFFFRGLFKGVITYRAAAIAFNFFLALIPFVLFIVTLIPFVTTPYLQVDLLDLLDEIIPASVYNLAESTLIEIVSRPSSGVLSIVSLLAIYFSVNGIDAILEGFNQSFHQTEIWPWWKQKVQAFFLMVALSFLVFISMSLLGFGKDIINLLAAQGIITHKLTLLALIALQWLIIILGILLSISLLYYFGQQKDREVNKYRFFSPGSILATTLFVFGGVLLKMYFENFSRYNLLYGSIGSLIILLIWLYYNAIILLIGYELNASIRKSRSEAVIKYKVVE